MAIPSTSAPSISAQISTVQVSKAPVAQACFAAPTVLMCVINGKKVVVEPSQASKDLLARQILEMAAWHQKQVDANAQKNKTNG